MNVNHYLFQQTAGRKKLAMTTRNAASIGVCSRVNTVWTVTFHFNLDQLQCFIVEPHKCVATVLKCGATITILSNHINKRFIVVKGEFCF